MKPFGDYVKIEKLEQTSTGDIVTSLAPTDNNVGFLVAGSQVIKNRTKVLYRNPVATWKEGDKTFVFVEAKDVIAYE